MFLQSLEIKNYRSLEYVRLEHLQQFNVLIGRNNVGKSAVFGALSFLSNIYAGRGMEEGSVLPAYQPTAAFEINLTFSLSQQDRQGFVNALLPAGNEDHRQEDLLNSPFFRCLDFTFRAPPGRPDLIHLRQTKALAEDGQWALLQKVLDQEDQAVNPSAVFVDIATIARDAGSNKLSATYIENGHSPLDELLLKKSGSETKGAVIINQPTAFTNFEAGNAVTGNVFKQQPLSFWPQKQLSLYLDAAFFFSPYRRSTARIAVKENHLLTRTGDNLAEVLHTINSNDRRQFMRIEQFVQAALPEIGLLQPKLEDVQTHVGFRPQEGDYTIRLHDMGGGVEQLLMIATVLFTTGPERTLFLEEPESHLHAGAQRFLLEKLYGEERQVFLTTHSPIFIDVARPHRLYRVNQVAGRTSITQVRDADMLSVLLEDIGVRNSDVLLSDAVLFVEGPGDQRAMLAWSQTLGKSFAEKNIAIVPIGGAEHAERKVPVRSHLLDEISRRARPVPHLFLLDRDERGKEEIHELEQLGGRVHLLNRREIENYLLVPQALLATLRFKHSSNAQIIERLDQPSAPEEVEQLIRKTADQLYGLVLLKRIRNELGGVEVLPRSMIEILLPNVKSPDLPRQLAQSITERLEQRFADKEIETVVASERATLDQLWADPAKRLFLAPGTEIVQAVFYHFGSKYDKSKDTAHIAQQMKTDEIAPEMQELIQRAFVLADPGST